MKSSCIAVLVALASLLVELAPAQPIPGGTFTSPTCGGTVTINESTVSGLIVTFEVEGGNCAMDNVVLSASTGAFAGSGPSCTMVGTRAVTTGLWAFGAQGNIPGTYMVTFTASVPGTSFATTCQWTIVVQSVCDLLVGSAPASLPLVPTHSDLLLVVPELVWPVTLTDIPTFHIPNDPSLHGLRLYAQVGMWNPVVFPLDPLQMSNGLDIILIEQHLFCKSVGRATRLPC